MRVLLIFVDGVGVGSGDPKVNPLAAADLPGFRELAGIPAPTAEYLQQPVHGDRLSVRGVDATLGMEGLPQSGTGQASILMGRNMAAVYGRHFGSWLPTDLRPALLADNVLTRFQAAGRSVAFANANPSNDPVRNLATARRPGAIPFAASGAGLMVRSEAEVRNGTALVSSIRTDRWRSFVDPSAPEVSLGDAARRLLAIAGDNDLTLFAHYDLDYVGHRGSFAEAVATVSRLDRFLSDIVNGLPDDLVMMVVSDHGNIEQFGTGHTRNPALFLCAGAGHRQIADEVESIADVAAPIERLAGVAKRQS